ncbi:hypothetical protein J2X92_004110 [Variovorax paradoxus]|nr:hypothetical protein [Variovorax paradoxus]
MTGYPYFFLPFRGRAGVGAHGATIERPACPHPNLPPEGEGAKP